MDSAKEAEKHSVDNQLLRSQVEELRKQNDQLRSILLANSIPVPPNLLADIL